MKFINMIQPKEEFIGIKLSTSNNGEPLAFSYTEEIRQDVLNVASDNYSLFRSIASDELSAKGVLEDYKTNASFCYIRLNQSGSY